MHRRPVVRLDGHVLGYALSVTLERIVEGVSATEVPASAPRPAAVPTALLHDEYMSLDLPQLVADRYAFIPATPAMLDGNLPDLGSRERLVLELPHGFAGRADAVERAVALRDRGIQLALSGYVGAPSQKALLPHVSFAIVDPNRPDLPMAALVRHVHAAGARVLASIARTPEAELACRTAGVDAVCRVHGEEGDSRPASKPTAPRVLRAGEVQCLALIHLLGAPELDVQAVAQVIDTDPILSVRVLHLVNSGAYSLSREVDTAYRAVILLGPKELTVLVTALLLDSRPDAMDSLWFILARSLTCETLASDPAAYTVGMLSALAVQLGVPAEVILEKVGVSDVVARAILDESGPLGSVLAAVRAHERADRTGVLDAGLRPNEVSLAYISAVTDALGIAQAATRQPGD